MSKRKKNDNYQKPEIEKQSDYYKLKTKAVDDLVNADESNSPEVSEEELRAYRSKTGLKLPDWLKIVFVKAWFPGAVCYFFLWGLGGYIPDQLDQLIVAGTALGIVTDLLTNNVLHFFEKTPGAYSRWMMFPKKGYASFPLNVLYGYVIITLVFFSYHLINLVIITATGAVDTIPLGVEPILFGLFCLGYDLLLIQVKHLLARLLPGARKKEVQ